MHESLSQHCFVNCYLRLWFPGKVEAVQLSECVFELLKTFCYFDQVSGRFRLGNVRCGSLQRIPLHLRQSGTHCHLTVARLSSPAKD